MSEVFIRVNPKTHIVEYHHICPFDPVHGLGKTKTELLKEGIFVEEYPEPVMIQGKRASPYYNQKENKVFYQYANVPLSDSERIGLLEDALNEILLGGMLNGNQ